MQRKQYTIKRLGTLDIHYRGKNVPSLFTVVETNSVMVIGLNFCKKFRLIKIILTIYQSQKRHFLGDYKDSFGETGILLKVHHSIINQKITPIITLARKKSNHFVR